MSSKIQRRDPCPCGSGKKYKNCCGRQGAGSSSKNWPGLKFGVLAIVVIGGGIAAYMFFSKPTMPAAAPPEEISTEALSKRVQPLQSQPLGQPPEGKVWSEEHGHWHDEQGDASDFAAKFTPQPPGEAPEGKVWSSEHGHWHDEPGAVKLFENPPSTSLGATKPSGSSTDPITITPSSKPKPAGELTAQPPGPAPEGKVWSEQHGHWHDEPGMAPKPPGEPGPQPPGPAPEGKFWSEQHGHWHNSPGASVPSGSKENPITITPTKPPETGSKDPE